MACDPWGARDRVQGHLGGVRDPRTLLWKGRDSDPSLASGDWCTDRHGTRFKGDGGEIMLISQGNEFGKVPRVTCNGLAGTGAQSLGGVRKAYKEKEAIHAADTPER